MFFFCWWGVVSATQRLTILDWDHCDGELETRQNTFNLQQVNYLVLHNKEIGLLF